MAYGFNANDDSDVGGFGAIGTGTTITRFFVGYRFNDNLCEFDTTGITLSSNVTGINFENVNADPAGGGTVVEEVLDQYDVGSGFQNGMDPLLIQLLHMINNKGTIVELEDFVISED